VKAAAPQRKSRFQASGTLRGGMLRTIIVDLKLMVKKANIFIFPDYQWQCLFESFKR
jgi:hypothetical protein